MVKLQTIRALVSQFMFWVSTVGFSVSVAIGHPTSFSQHHVQALEQKIKEAMEIWMVPGLSLGLVIEGEVVFAKGFGFRDLHAQLPVDQDTIFAIGSNTKSFTANLCGKLVDDQKIDWDTPVREYYPAFLMYDNRASQEMTFRDLLTHRSGLPRHDLVWYLREDLSRKQIVERLRYLEPTEPFRNKFQYQNLMFTAAGFIAGIVAGSTWETMINQEFFLPLGMSRSNTSVIDSQKDSNFGVPYQILTDRPQRLAFKNIDGIGPAGSINSTVVDMLKYIVMNLNQGKYGENQLISAQSSKQVQTAQIIVNDSVDSHERLGDTLNYGFGLMISSYGGFRYIFHDGGIDGFISAMGWLPEKKIGVVVLTNLSGNNPVPTILSRIALDIALGLEPIDWIEWAQNRYGTPLSSSRADKKENHSSISESKNQTLIRDSDEYVGRFFNEVYGTIELSKGFDDQLIATIIENGRKFAVNHQKLEIFEFKAMDPSLQQWAIQGVFYYDKTGAVDRLVLPLEQSVADFEFKRLADNSSSDPMLLKKLAGTYFFENIKQEFEVKYLETLNQLYLIIPDQPQYQLVPDRGLRFAIKGLAGFIIEFEKDQDGEIIGLWSRQPNGQFYAIRR